MKQGHKTSEFAITLATIAGQLGATLAGELPPEWAAAGSSAVAIGYAFARAFAKAYAAIATPPGE